MSGNRSSNIKNANKNGLSVIILTLNEEKNLTRCLDSLGWCDDIVVVDSFSTDTTEQICRKRNVRFYQNRFKGFGSQRNWAIHNVDTKHSWILFLDADERVPRVLADEMNNAITLNSGYSAYRLRRRLYIWGRWLRFSAMYPTWVVRLVHKERVHYVNAGHAETQEVKGDIGALENDLLDENEKGLEDWFDRQNRYSTTEAGYELESHAMRGLSKIFSEDPIERRSGLKTIASLIPFRPFWYFLYSYVVKGGFIEGRDGFYFCYMKAVYYAMIEIKKYDLKRKERTLSRDEN